MENQQQADNLNEFYCRFEKKHPTPALDTISTQPLTPPATPLSPTPAIQISEDEVRQVFRKQKRKKHQAQTGVTPACLTSCADQLAPHLHKDLQQITGTVRSPFMLQTLHHHPHPKEIQNYRTK